METYDRVEVIYRVYVRGHENVSLRFMEMTTDLEALGLVYNCPLVTHEQSDAYLPIKAEQEEKASKLGLLVTDFENKRCLVVREQRYELPGCGHVCQQLLAEIAAKFPDQFAVLQTVHGLSADIIAV